MQLTTLTSGQPIFVWKVDHLADYCVVGV